MRSFSLDATGRNVPVDSGARLALAPPPSDTVNEIVLAANTAKRTPIPANATFVIFSSTGDFRTKFGDSTVVAAIPSADVADGSASELNPAARQIPAGVTHISLIAAAVQNVTLSFYGK